MDIFPNSSLTDINTQISTARHDVDIARIKAFNAKHKLSTHTAGFIFAMQYGFRAGSLWLTRQYLEENMEAEIETVKRKVEDLEF